MATPPFERLVVLMLENRSFDHMLGFLKSPDYPVNGLDPDNLPTNDPVEGDTPVSVASNARTVGDLNPDPAHDFLNVNVQIFGNKGANPTGPLMRGFVKDYAAATHTAVDLPKRTLPRCAMDKTPTALFREDRYSAELCMQPCWIAKTTDVLFLDAASALARWPVVSSPQY